MANSNVTGGIVLLLVGSALIAVGVTDKGKQILNILLTGGSGIGTGSGTTPQPVVHPGYIEEGNIQSGGPSEPTTKTDSGYILSSITKNSFGFAGEKGAIVV